LWNNWFTRREEEGTNGEKEREREKQRDKEQDEW